MIRRFAIASLLTVASVAGLSSAASAVDGEVTFEAENAKKCVVGTAATFSLTQVPNSAGFTTSLTGTQSLPAQCNSNASIATSVLRTNGAALSVQTSSVADSLITYLADTNANGEFSIPVTITANNGGTSILPAANYNYTATVTVTPQ